MPSVLSNISKQHKQNLCLVVLLLSSRHHRGGGGVGGGGGVNLTIKFNLHLGGEKGSYEFYKISTGSLFLSLSCWCTKVGVKLDFSNISRTASIVVVQRDYMQTHTHSDS